MADAIATTSDGTSIGAWLLQADPVYSSIAADLADPADDGVWAWSCDAGERADLVAAGHPVLFWITENDHPALPSGLWLIGEATGPCQLGAGWSDEDEEPADVPYASMVLQTLATAIRREDLAAHPVLQGLEVLQGTNLTNPLIVTPEQLDALRADFDLTTGPLSEDLRDELRPPAPPELWVAGPEQHSVEVYSDDDGWTVWVDEDNVSEHEHWRDAYSAACRLGDPNVALTEDAESPTIAATLEAADGMIWIIRVEEREFEGYVEVDGEATAHAIEGRYPTLEQAVLSLAENLWGEDD